MISCFTLMPVISVKALASVLDSYSCVVMVSDTMLISMPLRGAADFSNHCNSFNWSALERVDGWNSLSIHFCEVASSARAGAAMVTDAAISAAALVMVRRLSLLLLKCRILVPPVTATKILFLEHENRYPLFSGSCSSLRPGLVPDLLFRFTQTVRKIATAETSEIAVASHRLEISTPSPIGSVAIGSVPKKAIHNRWMTAVVISEMNRRSPRVVGMRKIPTRSASG